jgi:hypothetical protein
MSATATSPSRTPEELAAITGAVRYRFRLETGSTCCHLCQKSAEIYWTAFAIDEEGSEMLYGSPSMCPHCVIKHGRDGVVMTARSLLASLEADEEMEIREMHEASLAQLEAGLFDLPLVLTEEMVAL